MTASELRLLKIMAIILFLGIIITYFFQFTSWYSLKKDEIHTTKTQYYLFQDQLTNLESVEKEINENDGIIKKLEDSFFTMGQVKNEKLFESIITGLAQKNSIVVNHWNFDYKRQKNTYFPLITIEGRGKTESVIKFIRSIEQNPYFFIIDRCSLRSLEKGRSLHISLKITCQVKENV